MGSADEPRSLCTTLTNRDVTLFQNISNTPMAPAMPDVTPMT